MKLYTKTGDRGETGLLGGQRVSKGDLRIDVYGELDHLNAMMGVVSSQWDQSLFQDLSEEISNPWALWISLQNWLFDLGSLCACPEEKRAVFQLPGVQLEWVEQLERAIDQYTQQCAVLKQFILPGGHTLAGHMHVCRTQCRRVERLLVRWDQRDREDHEEKSDVPEHAILFINRLSDYFFALARYVNHQDGCGDVLWGSEHIISQ